MIYFDLEIVNEMKRYPFKKVRIFEVSFSIPDLPLLSAICHCKGFYILIRFTKSETG